MVVGNKYEDQAGAEAPACRNAPAEPRASLVSVATPFATVPPYWMSPAAVPVQEATTLAVPLLLSIPKRWVLELAKSISLLAIPVGAVPSVPMNWPAPVAVTLTPKPWTLTLLPSLQMSPVFGVVGATPLVTFKLAAEVVDAANFKVFEFAIKTGLAAKVLEALNTGK